MQKIEDGGARIVYRRGARSAWWLAMAMPVGMVILFLLGSRDVMPYVGLAFAGAVMFYVAASDERLVIDIHARAVVTSETFAGRTVQSETIPFSRVTRLAVMPNYARERGSRHRTRRDGFALMLDWTSPTGANGIQLATFHDDAEVMAEAEKLAGILGTRVERDGV